MTLDAFLKKIRSSALTNTMTKSIRSRQYPEHSEKGRQHHAGRSVMIQIHDAYDGVTDCEASTRTFRGKTGNLLPWGGIKLSKTSTEWYKENPEKYERRKKQIRDRVKEIRIKISEYRMSKSCIYCGFDDHRAIDFHHRDPSEKNIAVARIASRGWSWERVEEELDKCDPVCRNCHAVLHYEERELAGMA